MLCLLRLFFTLAFVLITTTENTCHHVLLSCHPESFFVKSDSFFYKATILALHTNSGTYKQPHLKFPQKAIENTCSQVLLASPIESYFVST